MDWDKLPSKRTEILEAIDDAKAKGPSAIAELTILCMYLAGQIDNPHFGYKGPSGAKPLEYLQAMMKWLEEKGTNEFLDFRKNITQEHQKPQLPQQKSKAVSSSVAQRRVDAALRKALKSGYPHPRHHHRCCKALVDLWRKGVQKDDLQPLISAITDTKYFKDDHYCSYRTSAIKPLMQIGEWDRAIKIIEPTPIHRVAGINLRVAGARLLIETGRPDLARVMLERLMKQQRWFPKKRVSHIDIMFPIANAWACLGEATIARSIKPRTYQHWYLTDLIHLECTIAQSKYDADGIADPMPLLNLLKETPTLEPPKSRALTQLSIQHTLYAIGEHNAAWDMLNYLEETLLATPLWGKREHRTASVTRAIFPYIDTHTDRIYAFATGMLIGTAKDVKSVNEFWNIVFVVSGLKWLIWHWAGIEGVKLFARFLDYWRENPQLTTQNQAA